MSAGCANCYAEAQDKRWGHDSFGHGKQRRRTGEKYWRQPILWNMSANISRVIDGLVWDGSIRSQIAGMPETLVVIAKSGEVERRIPIYEWNAAEEYRPRVFCASLADWLDDEVPVEWLADLLALIQATPNLDWLLLTKRPEKFEARLIGASLCEHDARNDYFGRNVGCWMTNWLNGEEPSNVWIGATVENQEMADKRIPALLRIPAKVRFLSCEPLLWPVDLVPYLFVPDPHGAPADLIPRLGNFDPAIHWVICGGESGPNARPMHSDWARSLRDQCKDAGVAFFMKQTGGVRKPFPVIPTDLEIKEYPNA